MPWVFTDRGLTYMSPRAGTLVRDVAGGVLNVLSEVQFQRTLIPRETITRVAERERQLAGLLNTLPWWIGDRSPPFEPKAGSYLEGLWVRVRRIWEYFFVASARFSAEADLPSEGSSPADGADFELATAFIRARIPALDLDAARAEIAREIASNVARPIHVLTLDPNRPVLLRFALWAEMLQTLPCYHWELDRDALLDQIRSGREYDPKALPQAGSVKPPAGTGTEGHQGVETVPPTPREALCNYVDAVNTYIEFAREATAAGESPRNDDATRERHRALYEAILARRPDALAAGIRLGIPLLEMESILDVCPSLCIGYALHWTDTRAYPLSQQLVDRLAEPLARLGALIRCTPENPPTGQGAKTSETRLTPEFLSAVDLATRLKRNPNSVRSFLNRFARKHPDCRIEVDLRRKGESQYLYRVVDVLAALQAWAGENPGE